MAFRCANCGGNVVFDIASQKLKCQHCESIFDPESFRVRDESTQTDIPEADLSLFLCNGCGATLESTEDSQVGFCPYCGGQSMIRRKSDSGSQMERVIPFQIPKDQCSKLYQTYTKKILYLPRELKNAEFLNNFTGIYMPYYLYDVELQSSTINGSWTESHSSYDLEHIYQVDMEGTGNYCDVFYDASKYLDDEIAARALPFDTDKEIPFHPAYLSGFYADASTVPGNLYDRDAEKQSSLDVLEVIAADLKDQRITVNKKNSVIHTKTLAHHSALFPMWFLTWKKNNRVAYAVVNGESGKVVSDLPVDMKAFSFGSAGIAVLLFLILEVLFQPTPRITSMISLIAAALMAYSIYRSTKQLQEKQTHVHDKGWTEGEETILAASKPKPFQKLIDKWMNRKTNLPIVFLTLAPFVALVLFFLLPTFIIQALIAGAIPMVILFVTAYLTWKVTLFQQDIPEKYPRISMILILISVIINLLVVLISPVQDVWYYLGDVICIVGLILASIGMLRVYNIGTTHPLPKLFDRKEVEGS